MKFLVLPFLVLGLNDSPESLQIGILHKIEPEDCIAAKKNDVLKMHYTGTLMDGTVFDSSLERSPLEFTLGTGQVIKGWDQGLEGMCVGEKRRLKIPSDLAYGSRSVGPIPPNSPLKFDIELMAVNGKVRKNKEL